MLDELLKRLEKTRHTYGVYVYPEEIEELVKAIKMYQQAVPLELQPEDEAPAKDEIAKRIDALRPVPGVLIPDDIAVELELALTTAEPGALNLVIDIKLVEQALKTIVDLRQQLANSRPKAHVFD